MARLPAHWATAGYAVPNVCARHGEPEVARPATKFQSKAPGWAIPLVIFGAIVYLIVVLALRKTISVPGWPLCARCRSLRNQRAGWGIGLVVVGVTAFVLGVNAASDIGGLVILLGLVVLLVGIVVWALSGRVAIAGALVSGDGNWLEVAKAHPNFAAYVDAATAHAAQQEQAAQQQQYGAQQQYAAPQYGPPQQGQNPYQANPPWQG